MVIYIITIAALYSRKMAHIRNQIGFPIRHYEGKLHNEFYVDD